MGGREDGIGTVLPAVRPWWGYLWASFNSLVGLVGAASAGARPVRWRGVLLFEGGRTGLAWVLRKRGFEAITLGHVVVATERVSDRILAHELCHVTQHERWGPLFYPAYLLTSLAGYRRNPFEHRAERRAVEALARRAGGSGGLKSEAATQVAGGHAEPSGSPPGGRGVGMTRMRSRGVTDGTVAQYSPCERRYSNQTARPNTRPRMDAERFEAAYRRIWGALRTPGEPGLSSHARRLLRLVPAGGAISLTALAERLQLPKSSTSVLVKSLAEKGLVTRARDEADERRLRIGLTDEGRRRLADDTLLAPEALARALAELPERTREALLAGLEELARASDRLAGPPATRRPRRGGPGGPGGSRARPEPK